MSYYLSTKGQNAGTLRDGFPQKRRDEDSSATTSLALQPLDIVLCEAGCPPSSMKDSLTLITDGQYTALSKEDLVIHITLNELCKHITPWSCGTSGLLWATILIPCSTPHILSQSPSSEHTCVFSPAKLGHRSRKHPKCSYRFGTWRPNIFSSSLFGPYCMSLTEKPCRRKWLLDLVLWEFSRATIPPTAEASCPQHYPPCTTGRVLINTAIAMVVSRGLQHRFGQDRTLGV